MSSPIPSASPSPRQNPFPRDPTLFLSSARPERSQSLMSHSSRTTPVFPAVPVNNAQFETRSDINYPTSNHLRSLSPDDITKMKYKIELDKQVAEKQQRRTKEWETKMERDKKYVRNQPFGRHDHTTILHPQELEELLTKGRAPSPSLDMPQQYPLNHRASFSSATTAPNNYMPPPGNNYSSPPPPPIGTTSMPSQSQDPSMNNNGNFQRFYGPHTSSMPNVTTTSASINATGTSQPVKGDAHDPFLLYDPNKEGQNVFNIIPQQDLYDPWGRPGGGAPLIHPPTGQKFTRYSGSLQDKLNTVGPLGFNRKHFSENIEEQKRELELEQRRRQQEELEHRSNAGDTAEWISHLESSRFPLRMHLPTTQTTREYIGARGRYHSNESRALHNDLVRQAEERSRMQKINRYQDSIAELQHTAAQNDWWGRSGGGAPTFTNRRHNVQRTFEHPRAKWTTNHLGQLTLADDQADSQVKVYATDYYYPKTKGYSSHKNFYQMTEDEKS